MNRKQNPVGALLEALEPVVNPLVRALAERGLPPRAFALLETTGRRTGRSHVVPIGNGFVNANTFWVVAEHGVGCAYVLNLQAQPRVRVCVNGRWRTGIATVQPDDEPIARRRLIDRSNGITGRIDGVIGDAIARAFTIPYRGGATVWGGALKVPHGARPPECPQNGVSDQPPEGRQNRARRSATGSA